MFHRMKALVDQSSYTFLFWLCQTTTSKTNMLTSQSSFPVCPTALPFYHLLLPTQPVQAGGDVIVISFDTLQPKYAALFFKTLSIRLNGGLCKLLTFGLRRWAVGFLCILGQRRHTNTNIHLRCLGVWYLARISESSKLKWEMKTIHHMNAGKCCLRQGDSRGPFILERRGKKMHLLTGAFLNLLRLSHPANFKQVSEFSPQAMKKFKPDSS